MPKMGQVPYTVGVAVAECFKLSQDGTSGCLMVMPATSESWDFQ